MAGQEPCLRTSLSMANDIDEMDHIYSVHKKLSAKLNIKETRPMAVHWRKRDQFGRLVGKSHRPVRRNTKGKRKSRLQTANVYDEHIANNEMGTSSAVQETHNMIGLHIQELQTMLDTVSDGVEETNPAESTATKTWTVRQVLSDEKWRKARPQLLEGMLEGGNPPKGLCQQCNIEHAVISCADCLPKQIFCEKCDITVHQQYCLHNRSTLLGSSCHPLPPTKIFAKNTDGQLSLCEQVCLLPVAWPDRFCSCNGANVSASSGRHIFFININGRYDFSLPLLRCDSCHCQWTPGIKDLIENGYWPGTVDFHTVFAIDVFLTFEDLKISAPGLSRHAFIQMLESRSVRSGRVGNISGENFQRSFLEWTYCRHEIETLLGDNHFSCPACGDNMVAVSLDGNRKLYRFNRKGVDECPYFEGTFVAKDSDVETFVQGIRAEMRSSARRPSCGTSKFKAGKEGTRKEPRLDEEGMMTSVCRHCILFSGLHMFRGEVFAYPLYLQKELGKDHKIEFICTDVMCKYYPYVQRVVENHPDLLYLLQMCPFLSVMHAKGHSAKCEVEWSGRNQEGAGLTVGEEVEAVNAYLSRVATTTKYMSKARRTDMITIHARGWNVRKKQNLHRYLAQRYVKTKKRTAELEVDIDNLKTSLATTLSQMQQWVKDVKDWAVSSPKSINCEDPQNLQRLMEGLVLKIKQRKLELYKAIDNNKDRKPKRYLIAKDKKKLEEAISSYNSLVSPADAVDSADVILGQDFPIWPWDSTLDIPLETKKLVFDKLMLLSRLKEEDGILIKEMKNHCCNLTSASRTIKREILQIDEDLCKQNCPSNMTIRAYEGLKCILNQRLQEVKEQTEDVFSTYRKIWVDPTALQRDEEEEEGDELWDEQISGVSLDSDSSEDEKEE